MVCLFFQKQVQANICVTKEMVKEALDMLRGAVMIVYPMGLPPHDPIRMEFEGREDLAGTQVNSSTCCGEINRVTHLSFLDHPRRMHITGVFAADARGRVPAVVGLQRTAEG